MKPTLRVIGDVHGHLERYIEIALLAEHSIQVGDLGFNYTPVAQGLDSQHHRVVGGNHDNYEVWEGRFISQPPHFLGDYGIHEVPNFGKIFYVRGGYSIDWEYRLPGRTWWDLEEMPYQQLWKALDFYKDTKPDFVISHECPASIIDIAFGQKMWDGKWLKPSRTAHLLDSMWDFHKPKHWLFGHHHKMWSEEIHGTNFRCIPELGYVDFDAERNIIHVEDKDMDLKKYDN